MTWQKPLKVSGIIENLKQKIASLQERWYGARREIEQLRKENEQLRRREKQLEREQEQWRQQEHRLRQEQERLRQENEKLKRQLEEAQRSNKRQAAPFSCGRRKTNSKRPGRKPGAAYGRRYSKAIPQQVDEVIELSGATNGRRRLFPADGGRPIPSDPGASPVPPTAGVTVKPFPNKWMK